MFLRKFLISALMVSAIAPLSLNAHKLHPRLAINLGPSIHNPAPVVPAFIMPPPTRWDRLVQWAQSRKNYILPASAAAGVTAGLVYLAIPNNHSVLEKITSAGKLSWNTTALSAAFLGVNYFCLVELAD